MTQFSHLNAAGEARMVDISAKAASERIARAAALVRMQPKTLDSIFAGGLPKGDVLAVARVAGIQGAKRTAELIPLCHPLALTKVTVDFARDADDRSDDLDRVQGDRPDGRRNGSVDRRVGRGAHGLRHVQVG